MLEDTIYDGLERGAKTPTRPGFDETSAAAATIIPTTGQEAAIDLRGVAKRFGNTLVLDGIDLTLPAGSRLGVVGPSGGGKSTLLAIIAGLQEPDAGSLSVAGGRTARERLARAALMPQRDLLLPWRTALDNACLALENRGVARKEARRRAHPLFERFGLGQFEDRRPAELSGGMRQRIAFLRTLMADKDILLLDEPFGALDTITRGQMQEWLLGALNQEPRTVVLVTHDVEEALLLTDRVVVLSTRPGRIIRHFDVSIPQLSSRRETVTTPEFVALRETALEALEA